MTLGRPARLLAACLATLVLAGVTTAGASARQHGARSAPMLLGLMDDALLGNVPDVAFPVVHNLHAQVIRYDLSWAAPRPANPPMRPIPMTRPTTGRSRTASWRAPTRSAFPFY